MKKPTKKKPIKRDVEMGLKVPSSVLKRRISQAAYLYCVLKRVSETFPGDLDPDKLVEGTTAHAVFVALWMWENNEDPPAELEETTSGRPPVIGMIYISQLPPRSELKAMRAPSGLIAGMASFAGSRVSWVCTRAPIDLT